VLEAQLSKELGGSLAPGAQYPCDFGIDAHGVLDKEASVVSFSTNAATSFGCKRRRSK